MTDFDGLREQLSSQRRKLEDLQQEALIAQEAAKRTERLLKDLSRRDGPQHDNERTRLESSLHSAQGRANRAAEALIELRAEVHRLLEQFDQFTDPRDGLSRWTDQHPILLFPLRLETRFKTVPNGQTQLWVRVFPDACLIDTFEETLTDQEVTNTGLFWASIWRAGGDEGLERSAWRELVAAHGSGRAGWLVRQYMPVNPGDKRARDRANDVLLIILATEPLPAAATTYWEAFWRAGGPTGTIDVTARQVAYARLEDAVGADWARRINENYRPFNLNDVPPSGSTRAEVGVKVSVLRLPAPDSLATRRSSWSSEPRVNLLPERFVFVGYQEGGGPPLVAIGNPIRTPLVTGPDPNAPDDEQLKPVDDKLNIPKDMAWMFNFEDALQAGMALRVNLTLQQATDGFDRVIVLGLRLADSPGQGQQNLARLLEHHLHSRTGLELLLQGTPTNNTESGGAGYSFSDDPNKSFGPFFRQELQYSPEANPLLRRDGQWLATALAIPENLVRRIPSAGGTDQLEARAMQIALWPATVGYMMRSLLYPVFSTHDIAATRLFFTRYVSGRGSLPAVRIGDQPYGILPIANFERLNWPRDEQSLDDQRSLRREVRANFLARLYTIVQQVHGDWKPLAEKVSFIGKPDTDPDQGLLDVVGLHPSSVEYFRRKADSLAQSSNQIRLASDNLDTQLMVNPTMEQTLALLRRFGYTGEESPDLLTMIFEAKAISMDNAPINKFVLVDDPPPSESEPIRPSAGRLNYIQWLIEAAQTGIERLQQEQGFDGNKKPAALLYQWLRHAVQLNFHATAVRLLAEAGLIANAEAALREPPFIHIRDAEGSESFYSPLFRPADDITDAAGRRLGDYIAAAVRTVDPDLGEQIAALERLSLVPTARLERLFAEHIDTVSYRLDAWKTGLLSWRLERMRERKKGLLIGEGGDQPPGLYLGAYGWLESVRPGLSTFTPASLDHDLGKLINQLPTTRSDPVESLPPLMQDSANLGLVHTPSLNHAVTAAVLRSGYSANDGRLSVDLSSRRVRLALDTLEGMRGGQSLGALLGYQFERHVHDNGPLQVHALIYPLRRAFPLDTNMPDRADAETELAKDSIAAMNVVDGRKLIDRVEQTGIFTYPFGVETLPSADDIPGGADALTNALDHIRNINDAIADLALAEGVHQAVLGNYDRLTGMLDAFAKGNYPPEPEVVSTPRSGVALTLRTAIHLPLTLSDDSLSPLAQAEPAVNAWLMQCLPASENVGCWVTFVDCANTDRREFITQAELGLNAIDLLYRVEVGDSQALNDLDDRILDLLYTDDRFVPRHDRPITIRYTERATGPGQVTWFELQPLLSSLRALVVSSRPLQPADLMRHNDSRRDEQASVSLDPGRIENALIGLRLQLPALDVLAEMLADLSVPIDAALNQFAGTLGNLAAYRLPGTGVGAIYEWRAKTYAALAEKVTARVNRWQERLRQFAIRMDDYALLDSSTPDAERIRFLQSAEAILSTHLTRPDSLPAYLDQLNITRRDFGRKMESLRNLVENPHETLHQFLMDANSVLPLDAFDFEPLDFSDTRAEIDRFRLSLVENVRLLKADVESRIAGANDLMLRSAGTATVKAVQLIQEAGQRLFGDDFVMIPQMTLTSVAADELANAYSYSLSGQLTAYLSSDPGANPPGQGRDFPVDDWLHGVARVREKMHHWENVLLLCEAFASMGAQPPELTPLQLPFRAGDPWLALEYRPGYVIDSDRLLYNAHIAVPFVKTDPVCGLLVDEWTEVIPGREETTGVTFHFNRPNAEPPNAWLLALPAGNDGVWSWSDLLAAVNDTLDSAWLRLIEPDQINDLYCQLLPATLSAYTMPEISISNNQARHRLSYDMIKSKK